MGNFRYQCIPSPSYCDYDVDCTDGSDEPDTCDYNFCPRDFVRCENSECVAKVKLCDGKDDCADKSDEDS